MEVKNKKKEVVIHLSNDEALILYDWLARFNENDYPKIILDNVEESFLYDLEAILEKKLTDTFKENYPNILEKAKREYLKSR